MKVFVAFACAVAAAQAGIVVPKVVEEGGSVQYRSEDGLGNYQFGYDEKHTTGGSFRKEKGDNYGRKVGSYGLHDADGRVRVVNYVADEHGFRAAIQTNEPGVAPEDPAAASINKAPVAVPYAAPMHLDHITGINVGLAHSVAAPIAAQYSAPIAQVAAPIAQVAAPVVSSPVGYFGQPHFNSVLGPSVSHMIGSMPAYIGSYLAAQQALPLQKAISYNAPIVAAPVSAAPVATAAYAAPVQAAIPAQPVVYKSPAHYGSVVGPSVDYMINQYVPQHLAAQKFYRNLHSPAVAYETEPVVSRLDVAPAAPVAAIAAPVSIGKSIAYTAAPSPIAITKSVEYQAAPIQATYAAAPVASYAAPAPVASYASPVAAYSAGSIVSKSYAAQVGSYAAAPYASYAAGPSVSYAAPVQSYAAAPIQSYAAAPVQSYAAAPVVEKQYAYAAPVSAAPVTPVYAKAAYAAPVVEQQYAAYSAPAIQKQIAYGPAALSYGAAPLVGKYATETYAAPVSASLTKIADYAEYAPHGEYYGAHQVAAAATPISYGYGLQANGLATASAYAAPVYAAAPIQKSPIYSYGPLSLESTVSKPAVFAAPAFESPAALTAPIASPIASIAAPVAHVASHVQAPLAAVSAAPVATVGLASTGVSSLTAGVNGYSHELVKPNAYTRVYQYMYGHAPSFYGYAYSPIPFGYKKK